MKLLEGGPCCCCLQQLGKLHCIGGVTYPRQRQQPAEQRAGSCFEGRGRLLRSDAAAPCTGRTVLSGRSLLHGGDLAGSAQSATRGGRSAVFPANQGFLIGCWTTHTKTPSFSIAHFHT